MKALKFQADDGFYKVLKSKVNLRLTAQDKDQYGGNALLLKNAFLLSILAILYFAAIFASSKAMFYVLYAIMGPASIVMAINICHDAAHGVAHRNKFINKVLLYQMDLVGPNSHIWKKRHKEGHHTYPNIEGHDPDLKQSVLARIFPTSTKLYFHKFQHIYVPFLYGFYTLNLVFVRDITDLFGEYRPKKAIDYVSFFSLKIAYVSLFILIPLTFTHFDLATILTGFFFLHLCAGYFITIALVPSHVSDHSTFFVGADQVKMPHSWAKHQVLTTIDFATKSKFFTWLLGGFNHHLTHHLFPDVSYANYPLITPLVKQTIEEFNMPYIQTDSLWQAYLAHYRLLKNNAINE